MNIRPPKSPDFIDDEVTDDLRNLGPIDAAPWKRFIDCLNHAACRPRPVYTLVGSNGYRDADPLVRQLWATTDAGWPKLSGQLLLVPTPRAPADSTDNGVRWLAGDDGALEETPSSTTSSSAGNPAEIAYPRGVSATPTFISHAANFDSTVTLRELQLRSIVGSTAAFDNGPEIRSGLVYEDFASSPETPHQAVSVDFVKSGANIVGGDQDDGRTLATYRDIFRRAFRQRRPAFGWSADLPGTHFVSFGAVTTSLYVFDMRYGEGGTAPSLTGPGINLPLRYAASGRGTTERVYVSLYARMSGHTNTGRVTIYNRGSSGSMISTPVALTNGLTISGNTYQWYPPAGSWSDSDPYFLGNATAAYDHILLCGRNVSGSTDHLEIAAFSFHVRHVSPTL